MSKAKKKSQKQTKQIKPASTPARPVQIPAKQPNRLLLAIAGIVVLLAVATGAIILSRPGSATPQSVAALPKEVSVAQAADMREQGAFILDVREQSEWNEYHMPGATLIPLGDLESRLSEVPEDQEIVVVCRSGNRSASGRDILLNAGFDQVTSMAGGMSDWRAQGLPVETGP